jgi:plastocyanin
MVCVMLVGCGTSRDTQPTVSPQAMTHPRVVTHEGGNPDALYVPNPIRVHVGQTVTWTNDDNEAHDVTAENGLFDSGPIAYHRSFSWRATRPGRFPYFCTLHPDMHGVIIVSH